MISSKGEEHWEKFKEKYLYKHKNQIDLLTKSDQEIINKKFPMKMNAN